MDIDHFCLKCQGGRFSENIWHLIGRTDAEAETAILWSPDVKNWLIWKDPGVRNDWRWEEKGTTEDEMAGWYHRSNGHELGQTPGDGEGQGGLTCCSPWVSESDMTRRLNNKYHLTYIIVNVWRRRWHPTPVLLPEKSHGQRSLVGCSPWGCKESDTT